jgi:hypothetical protein
MSVGHVGSLAEAARDRVSIVGVTAEADRFSAFLAPPSQDDAVERHLRAHLKCSA